MSGGIGPQKIFWPRPTTVTLKFGTNGKEQRLFNMSQPTWQKSTVWIGTLPQSSTLLLQAKTVRSSFLTSIVLDEQRAWCLLLCQFGEPGIL